MKITVGIPTYNRAKFLSKAIASVLRQTYTNFEILVRDDCSTDTTEDTVRGFGDSRIIYVRSEFRCGVPKNWNECVRRASGEFFALLPDDDEYEPRFLEAMAECLDADASIAFVQCGMTAIDENSRVIDTDLCSRSPLCLRGEEALEWQFSTLKCNPAAILFRRSTMMERGLWREDYLDDWALIFKLAFWHGFRFLPEPLARNRNHSTNLTKQFAQAGRDGILDIVNQVSDVFGDALPATPRLLALRASLDRKVSRMCIRASVKACYRRDWKRAAGNLKRAHYLFPLALFDPMQAVDITLSMLGRVKGAL